MKCIASHPAVKKAVQKYNLKDSFDKLAEKLNNYVHSNGYLFYNESFNQLIQRKKVKEKCDEFSEAAIFVTVSFLFLVVLIRSLLIMSCDYTDYLDGGGCCSARRFTILGGTVCVRFFVQA